MRIIHPPEDYQIITSFGSAVDLRALSTRGRNAVSIYIETGSGTLSVKMTASDGATRVLTVSAGDEIIGQFTSIEAASGVSKIRVGWN